MSIQIRISAKLNIQINQKYIDFFEIYILQSNFNLTKFWTRNFGN